MNMLLNILYLLFTLSHSLASPNRFYPLDAKGLIPKITQPYSLGDHIPMDCISRNKYDGENKFDHNHKIVYIPFPRCRETGKPLAFSYGVDTDQKCTISFTKEIYQLFQLYIHEDVPFSCRVPLSPESHYIERGGATIPLTFLLRGNIFDLHLDIDTSLNVLFTTPKSTSEPSHATIVSAVAFGLGTNTSRVVVGDYVTFTFAIRWLKLSPLGKRTDAQENGLPFPGGFYTLPQVSSTMPASLFYKMMALTAVASAMFSLVMTYGWSMRKEGRFRYKSIDSEMGKHD